MLCFIPMKSPLLIYVIQMAFFSFSSPLYRNWTKNSTNIMLYTSCKVVVQNAMLHTNMLSPSLIPHTEGIFSFFTLIYHNWTKNSTNIMFLGSSGLKCCAPYQCYLLCYYHIQMAFFSFSTLIYHNWIKNSTNIMFYT